MLLIGITGTIGAGKGTIVDYLVRNKNFIHLSVRDFLIEEIKNRSMPVNRDSMVIVANDLRSKFSPSYIIEQLHKKALLSKKSAIIESIRNIGEVDYLRKQSGFYLFAIDADPEVRYKRITIRQSETDRLGFEEFLMNEKREMNSADPNAQNLSACIKFADFLFNNDDTPEALYLQIEKILAQISS